MASRSATVLVIFVIAIIAFCLASVFGAMTGPISILPNENETSAGILDNLSAITDGTGDTGVRYGSDNYHDYSSSSDSNVETTQDSGQSNDQSNVETTSDDSSASSSDSSNGGSNGGDSNQGSNPAPNTNNNPNVETTTSG